MDLAELVGQWKGREVVAFCGSIKFRGILEEMLEGGFMVMTKVAVMNPAAQETSEYESCIINVAEVSGLAYEERVGRGGELAEEFQDGGR